MTTATKTNAALAAPIHHPKAPTSASSSNTSERIPKTGYGSESEADDEAATLNPATDLGRINRASAKNAIKLQKIGPRMMPQLVKVEVSKLRNDYVLEELYSMYMRRKTNLKRGLNPLKVGKFARILEYLLEEEETTSMVQKTENNPTIVTIICTQIEDECIVYIKSASRVSITNQSKIDIVFLLHTEAIQNTHDVSESSFTNESTSTTTSKLQEDHGINIFTARRLLFSIPNESQEKKKHKQQDYSDADAN
ncbi:Brix domain-containing protein [Forsythia ovata]|uniref:Brix domain-containing protein n=1 Tax=Forsythia ovata TaxID=205694 RepID=A0ABD1T8B7_9LAMI